MEKSKDKQRIILFRDMREEGWRSMNRYADNLLLALSSLPESSSFSFTSFTCSKTNFLRPCRPLFKWLPVWGSYLNDLYFSRFLKYPRLATRESKKFILAHVLDHSYAHLLYRLQSPLKVVTCHDLLPLEFEKDRDALRVFRYSVGGLGKADLILADSKDTQWDLEDRLGIDRGKIRVVPLAVDLRQFRSIDSQERLAAAREQYHLPRGKMILHVGSSAVYKNQENILRALSLLRGHTSEEVFFLKVGRLTDSQRRLSKQLGVAERVLEREAVPDQDLVSLFNLADLLAYPSLKEGFGFPVLEAMACGLPVLVSRGTSLEEIAGGLGVLVDPRSAGEIAQGVNDSLFGHRYVTNEGKLALRRRAEQFTWQKTAASTLAAYEELIVGFGRQNGSVK